MSFIVMKSEIFFAICMWMCIFGEISTGPETIFQPCKVAACRPNQLSNLHKIHTGTLNRIKRASLYAASVASRTSLSSNPIYSSILNANSLTSSSLSAKTTLSISSEIASNSGRSIYSGANSVASQALPRPNLPESVLLSASQTGAETASQRGAVEPFVNGYLGTYQKAAIILAPLQSLATTFAGVATGVAQIYSSRYTVETSRAISEAHQAQARANALFGDVNQLNLNEKRAGIKVQIVRFQSEIDKIKKNVKELEKLNENGSETQKFYNNKIIDQNREEIRLKEAELNVYKNAVNEQ